MLLKSYNNTFPDLRLPVVGLPKDVELCAIAILDPSGDTFKYPIAVTLDPKSLIRGKTVCVTVETKGVSLTPLLVTLKA